MLTVFVERPLTRAALRWARHNRVGLLNYFELPPAARTPIALAFLDYANFVWHAMNHKVPALWHFHRWHHQDAQLDATTGARVHPVEQLLAIAWRTGAALLIGADESQVQLSQLLTTAATLFQHANVALPQSAERALEQFAVTPHLHATHHSNLAELRATNFGAVLSTWDRAHRTLETQVPQEAIVVGVKDRSLV